MAVKRSSLSYKYRLSKATNTIRQSLDKYERLPLSFTGLSQIDTLQVRVGSILKKAYTVKAGKTKTLDCRKIYLSYAPSRSHGAAAFFYDESCQPYVWIHNASEFNRMVKQQYMSLEDLRDYSEIKICREAGRESFAVYKKPRSDRC